MALGRAGFLLNAVLVVAIVAVRALAA